MYILECKNKTIRLYKVFKLHNSNIRINKDQFCFKNNSLECSQNSNNMQHAISTNLTLPLDKQH